MKTFRYVAFTEQGEKKIGIISAGSEKEARSLLREKGLLPSQVIEKMNFSSWLNWLPHRRVSKLELSIITRELAELLQGGIPLLEALGILSQQIEKPALKKIILEVKDKIKEGYSFSAALKEYTEYFSNIYIATIAAGEESGCLPMVMSYLAEYSESQYETQQKVTQALVYPALMTVVSISIVVFLLIFVFPKFIGIFEEGNQPLPTITQLLLSLTNIVSSYYGLIIAAIIILVVISMILLKNPWFSRKKDILLLQLPMIGRYLSLEYSAQFTRVLSVLLKSGVGLVEAVQISSQLIDNITMRNAIYVASLQMREGQGIAKTLNATGYFNPLTINFIANGEASGNLAAMLSRISDIHRRNLARLLSIFLTLFEPMLILIMGTVVLFIVLAMLLPMLDISQMIV
jgi:general secretion pathway protein F